MSVIVRSGLNADVRFPAEFDPEKTSPGQRLPAASFHHLIGAKHQPSRYRMPDRLRSFHIDHQLEAGRLLHWNVSGFDAAQDLRHHPSTLTVHLSETWTVGQETAHLSGFRPLINGRQAQFRNPFDHETAVATAWYGK